MVAIEPTPEWWRDRLLNRIRARRQGLDSLNDYYEGRHQLTFTTAVFRKAFGASFKNFSDNWTNLVVDAVEERLHVNGVKTGSKGRDTKAWSIWKDNNLDADAELGHTEALIYGASYVLVWPEKGMESPTITVEDSRSTIVEMMPGSRRLRAAALKEWLDEEGFHNVNLYLPNALYKWRSVSKVTTDHDLWVPDQSKTSIYEKRFDPGVDDWPIPNRLGVVPIVPLANRPRVSHPYGTSEIEEVLPVQDAINKLTTDMLIASEFGAAPQRWATGLTIPKDPKTGKALPVFEHMVNRMLVSPSKESHFGQFPQTDLRPFVEGIQMLIQHLASRTRTPPHYFYLSGQFPSGESIKSAETGLVAKARNKMTHFGGSWAEVMRIALIAMGEPADKLRQLTVSWGDPESRSESEHTDAVMKQRALGVPYQVLWDKLGYSAEEIDRFKQMRAEEATWGIADVAPAVGDNTNRLAQGQE